MKCFLLHGRFTIAISIALTRIIESIDVQCRTIVLNIALCKVIASIIAICRIIVINILHFLFIAIFQIIIS